MKPFKSPVRAGFATTLSALAGFGCAAANTSPAGGLSEPGTAPKLFGTCAENARVLTDIFQSRNQHITAEITPFILRLKSPFFRDDNNRQEIIIVDYVREQECRMPQRDYDLFGYRPAMMLCSGFDELEFSGRQDDEKTVGFYKSVSMFTLCERVPAPGKP